MIRIYASETYFTTTEKEIVELVDELELIKQENYSQYVLGHKKLSDFVREDMEIDQLISIHKTKENEVRILIYDRPATDLDVFTLQVDEEGRYYIEIKE
jgi:hypothetical protein